MFGELKQSSLVEVDGDGGGRVRQRFSERSVFMQEAQGQGQSMGRLCNIFELTLQGRHFGIKQICQIFYNLTYGL